MKKGQNRIVAVVLTAFLALPAGASDWWLESTDESPLIQKVVKKETHSGYRVNWVKKHLEVMAGATVDNKTAVNQAHAISMATKTARHLAYEKLAESVRGLHITADARYDRELMLDANVKTDLEATIRGATVIAEDTSEFPDGSVWVEVTLALDLLGPDGVSGPVTRADHRRKPAPYYELSSVDAVPSGGSGSTTPTTTGSTTQDAGGTTEMPDFREKHSGLIIDALQLDGRPVLIPRIVTASGLVLYDERMVNQKYMEKHALVAYAPTVDAAKALARTGKNPLVVRAIGVSGDYPGDIVVSDDAAALIAATIKDKKILKKCGVAIVL